MKNRAFTLTDLLVVLAFVVIAAALLFPIFARARARVKAWQTVCTSNLRQIGSAVFLYARDNDDLFPYGVDASDKYTDAWRGQTRLWPAIKSYPLLPDVLSPYLKSRDVWRCPADTGFDYEDAPLGNVYFTGRPSSYRAYGMSYYYRTSLALDHKTLAGLVGYDAAAPHAEHGPAEVNVLCDGRGSWHGGSEGAARRYDVLMADGHVVYLSHERLGQSWDLRWSRPKP